MIMTLLFSFVSCNLSNLQEVVPLNHHYLVEDTTAHESGDDHDHFQAAYPSYFNMFEDGKFKGLIKETTDVLTLESVDLTPTSSVKKVNVKKYGAKGDGSNDDTEAFEKAWKAACSSKKGAVMVVPEDHNYLLKPIRFSGPCESKITLQILGTLEASDDRSDYEEDERQWLMFDGVDNLVVSGGGTINGNGKIWWKNSCKINEDLPCKGAPTAITFYECKNLVVKDLNIRDAQQMHTSFEKCVNVQAYNLSVTAPEKSPNTDGIHVTNTQNMQISDCVIGTGDDCISIVSGSKNVQVTDITCGPGHGISIGSLGARNSEAYVSGVTVKRAKLTGTTNGVRIKTWQGGSGYASNITFANIEMKDVYNPIIINQNYCDQDEPCKQQRKAVQVKNVLYKNIKGTSASSMAVKFDCSKAFPCQGVTLQDIDLTLEGEEEEKEAKAECNNVEVSNIGTVSPQCD
ncbi:hypothetical protein L484_018006 [Morus notabilis]|uniref:endo-polygalacturonase n=1 Tax=Morus notabilis TaxID=981085 RepID=W9S7P3_9ROSA|nr:polygalacturonase [Morus notabilis]EXB93622.1 hypothetical protein L484_018006 [Morus notabilis]